MTYWEYTAAASKLNTDDSVERPDAETVQNAFAMIAANPAMVN